MELKALVNNLGIIIKHFYPQDLVSISAQSVICLPQTQVAKIRNRERRWKKSKQIQNRRKYWVESVGGKSYLWKAFRAGGQEWNFQTGSWRLETLLPCSASRKEAGQELTVLRTTFSCCAMSFDPSQNVGDHRSVSKLFGGGVSLGTQIPVMKSPLQFGNRSTWRSQKNNQLWISSYEISKPALGS